MLSDDRIAELISSARAQRRCLPAPLEGVGIDVTQAYRVQALMTQARIARGESVVGWKLGYTSDVMRAQMNIAEPNFGPLTDAMVLQDGATVPESVIHPRVEPEVAVVLGSDLAGDVDLAAVTAAVGSAHAALEIVDSVWCDYKFGWADNTADGSSAAFIVLGPMIDVGHVADLTVALTRNGDTTGAGSSAAAMGDPLVAVQWLCRQLQADGRILRRGDVVMTGGITAAVPLEAGDVISADFGGVRVEVTRGGRLGS